jgi:hypothetical protein
MAPRIFTHMGVDLDATASVWWQRRQPGYEDAEVKFVPANWQGDELEEGDIALDLDAKGRGIKGTKGEDGWRHSCFAALLKATASEEDQRALRALVAFIDTQDTFGSVVRHFAPAIGREAEHALQFTGVNAVLRALQAKFPKDDAKVLERMSEIYDGMLEVGRRRLAAEDEADQAEWVGSKVAISREAKLAATRFVLVERGADVVVYTNGCNVGIWRNQGVTLRMDHPDLVAVVELFGEKVEGNRPDRWFAHPDGFLLCWGDAKAPRTTPSAVDPKALAEAAARLLG